MKLLPALVVLLFFLPGGQLHGQTEQVKKYLRQSKESKYPLNISLLVTADSFAAAQNDIAGLAAVNLELGQCYYKTNADKAIIYFIKANDLYSKVKNKKKAAFCLQNIAFTYDERKHDFSNAAIYARGAVQGYREIRDTMQQANMQKYLCYLLGRTHHFAEAKENAADAITLFTAMKFTRGVAVSYRDLAIVYVEEHKSDSAISLLLAAKNIWKEYNDTFRLFDINNELLNEYNTLNRQKDALAVFFENRSMLKSRAVYFQKNWISLNIALCSFPEEKMS